MAETILYEAPGIVIAQTDEAVTLVPYGSETHDEGDQNHGWKDLRDRPELVLDIPEAQKSAGLADFLRVLAEPGALMTFGCECGVFDAAEGNHYAKYAGGYISVAFREAEFNTPDSLYNLVCQWMPGVPVPSPGVFYEFEIIIEPLRSFFGRRDLFGLMVKPAGRGHHPAEAWANFDHACRALTAAYQATRRQ